MRSLVFALLLAGCSSASLNRGPSSALEASPPDNPAQSLENILRPHVQPLDRDLTTFRYEHDRPGTQNPRTLLDIVQRETSWAARFFDVTLKTGDDVGPGVFVATDPNATATWGMESPHLLVFTLKAGSMILNGEGDALSAAELSAIKSISKTYSCESEDDRRDRPVRTYSEMVGAFRNSNREECRRFIVSAAKRLFLQGIVYGFESVPLAECRASGTAISIVDFSAVDAPKINYYEPSSRIEGDPELTPLVAGLFEEGKDDYHAQAVLNSVDLWRSYRRAFGFFDHDPKPEPARLRDFKLNRIFKCGPKWSIETDTVQSMFKLSQLVDRDPEFMNLQIETALSYNALANRLQLSRFKTSAAEFSLSALKAILRFTFRNVSDQRGENAFAMWLRARLARRSHDDLTSITQHAGEPEVDPRAVAEMLDQVMDVVPSRPGSDAVQTFLLKSGLGPHSATYTYNRWQMDAGGVPYLRGVITSNLARRAYLRKINREVVMKILRRCDAVYLDPKTTAKSLGECNVFPN